jgi:hypothetical protein
VELDFIILIGSVLWETKVSDKMVTIPKAEVSIILLQYHIVLIRTEDRQLTFLITTCQEIGHLKGVEFIFSIEEKVSMDP